MTIQTRAVHGLYRRLVLGLVVLLVLAGGLWWVLRDPGGTRLSAYFGRTVGVYAGSTVRVLGISVGEVTGVTPQGAAVRVDMRLEGGVAIPANAGAVVVAPSLVSDRYVQLTPAYDSGERLREGAVIPLERTATPAELDDLYGSLDELATSLGPDGANGNGALSAALDTMAANLAGNGRTVNDTVTRLAGLSRTLEGTKEDLFSTVRGLRSFTGALAESDRQINEFHSRVADVTGFLAADAPDVGAALSSLATSLGQVQGFVVENRDLFTANVGKLAGLTQVLVDQRAALAEVLDLAPLGATNFINSYDAASGTIAVRDNLNEITHPPILTLCRLLAAGTPKQVPDTLATMCKDLAPVLDGTLALPSVPQAVASLQAGTLPPLPLPLVGALTQLSGGRK
jgi:phospholipid/cholesterol/gamma-HCH transport system substrate-binding protein